MTASPAEEVDKQKIQLLCDSMSKNQNKKRFKCTGGLIFSDTSRAYPKILKSNSHAQKWQFRLNKEEFCDSVLRWVVDQTCFSRFEYLNYPILSLDDKVMAKTNYRQHNSAQHSFTVDWEKSEVHAQHHSQQSYASRFLLCSLCKKSMHPSKKMEY